MNPTYNDLSLVSLLNSFGRDFILLYSKSLK